MNINLEDMLLKSDQNKLDCKSKIILPENLITAIKDCRTQSESHGIEHGFNIYKKNDKLEIGGMITGEKTVVQLGPRDGEPNKSAIWLGSCHAHPYMWKLSKRAAIGPSSGDIEGYRDDFDKLTYNRGVHFVISNWRLYMLIYFKKPNSATFNDYLPLNIVDYAEKALPETITEENKQQLQAYNSQWFWQRYLQKKPADINLSQNSIEDLADKYYANYSKELIKYHECTESAAYLGERNLNKSFKKGRPILDNVNLAMDRANLWTEKSLEYTKEYCNQAGVGLALADMDMATTTSGRDEDDFNRPKVEDIEFEKLSVICMPKK